jgi:hypothetical protein
VRPNDHPTATHSTPKGSTVMYNPPPLYDIELLARDRMRSIRDTAAQIRATRRGSATRSGTFQRARARLGRTLIAAGRAVAGAQSSAPPCGPGFGAIRPEAQPRAR